MNIINETQYSIDEQKIEEYINFLFDKTKIKDKTFSLVFIDNDEMQKYNMEFRNKNYPTDVLTFCEDEDGYLGDILVNIDKVQEQAKEYNHSEKRELFFLITHGYLHLLGYDHMSIEEEKEMFSLQEKLLGEYNITR